jgi:serine protease
MTHVRMDGMPARLRGLFAAVAVALAVVGTSALPARASNDPLFPRQWNLIQANVPAAWQASSGDGVVVGVIDTGVAMQHEDLAGRIQATADCTGGTGTCRDGGGQDDHGHGTHVSGIIAADRDNGKGVAGVAPAARLVEAKALDSDGSGNTIDIAAAMQWAVDHGARIINLSFGPDAFKKLVAGSNRLLDSINRAWDSGAIPVLAAGNTDGDPLGLSENYGALNAVVVGATAKDGSVASYSRPLGNAKWGLVAPGGSGGASSDPGFADNNVISTFWTAANPTSAYAAAAGTSMAAPMVSGVLALLLAKGYSRDAAVQRVLTTTDAVACGAGCHGRLDAGKALGAAAPPTTSAPRPVATTRATHTAPPSTNAAPVTIAPSTTSSSTTSSTTPEPPVADTAPTVPEVAPQAAPPRVSHKAQSRVAAIAGATLLLGGAGTALALWRLRGAAAP